MFGIVERHVNVLVHGYSFFRAAWGTDAIWSDKVFLIFLERAVGRKGLMKTSRAPAARNSSSVFSWRTSRRIKTGISRKPAMLEISLNRSYPDLSGRTDSISIRSARSL